MNQAPYTVPLPDGYLPLAQQVRDQLGPSLGALLMFGSCLSESTRQPDSVPDLLALVDDLGAALGRLGCGPFTRALAARLPPLTLALRGRSLGDRGRTLAKLNLIELTTAQRAVRELPDLYLAGRLSKPTAWLWQRDAQWHQATETLLQQSVVAVADLTLRGLPGGTASDLSAVVLLYIGQSYLAELRPEGRAKWLTLRHSFPAFYQDRVRPLLLTRAPALGLRPVASLPAADPGDITLLDERTPTARRTDHQARARLLQRSRLRTVARWPKMMLVYRGWAGYLAGKLRRLIRQQLPSVDP